MSSTHSTHSTHSGEPSADDHSVASSEAGDLDDSNPYNLHRAVYARRAEYVRPHKMRIKIGTWNVAACSGTDQDLASWFVTGKGVDRRLANLDIPHSRAIEREDTADSLDHDPDAVRLMGGDKIGLYVLGLQEVIPLNAASQYVTRVYTDTGTEVGDRWQAALEEALPPGYKQVSKERLFGLLLLVYASPEIHPSISNVSTVSTGTGLLGYVGNKGAVSTRFMLGETTRLLFVNSHLASGEEQTYLDRRCWDVAEILKRTQFDPIVRPGFDDTEKESIGDEDFGFWFGDLNFRLDGIPGDDIRRILMLHTRGEYGATKDSGDTTNGEEPVHVHSVDSGNDRESGSSTNDESDSKSSKTDTKSDSEDDAFEDLPDPDDFLPDPADDPTSLQATLDSLLPHDQLRRMIKQKKVFHEGWREGPITFLPSYKYDVGTVGHFDSSGKRRNPSWCDRILYRSRKDKSEYDRRVKEAIEARKRDDEMKKRGLDDDKENDDILFDYDPENDGEGAPSNMTSSETMYDYDEYDDDGDDGDETEEVVTKDGFVDRLHLDIYASHQRVQSSDHKPVISILTLDYDAVVPELKAKVHAEVVRELDRAENEGRPEITIVVDGGASSGSVSGSDKKDSGDHQESGESIDFGDITFLSKKYCALTIANTGRVASHFSFVEKPSPEDGVEYGKQVQWLSTSFSRDPDEASGETVDISKEVSLEPGDTVTASIEILVDDLSLVRQLNDGQQKLEDILVLRVKDGRDYFLPIRGEWMPTCIGRSIDELIRIPDGGIRKFIKSHPDGKKITGSIPYDTDVRCAAPKELFKLTELLETLTERVLADENMLEDHKMPKDKAGWPFEHHVSEEISEQVVKVIEMLDKDGPIAEAFEPETPALVRLEVVSRVLLLFLQGLTDGIITIPLWSKIEYVTLKSKTSHSEDAIEDDKATILDVMSTAPNHNISLVFLTTTLAKVITELCPITKAEADILKTSGRGVGALGRRSLSFRKSGGGSTTEALAALERREAKGKRFAEVFGKAVCRYAKPAKEKERRASEEKERTVLELLLKRVRDD